MNNFKTDQEVFWNGEFGDEYVSRNTKNIHLSNNIALFSKILNKTSNVRSVIEFGSNIGLNLRAINQLSNRIKLRGVEINQSATAELKTWGKAEVIESSIFDYDVSEQFDFSLIKGVLIHINPDFLENVYDKLYQSSKKYICVAEYYNPSPVSIPYRGHSDKLFKRDFAGEILDKYTNLELVDYGFCYHRDNNYPQDDITWFLMKKH